MIKGLTAILALLVMVSTSGCMSAGPIAGCFSKRKVDYDSVKAGITKQQMDEAIGEVGYPVGDGRTFVYRFEHVEAPFWRAGVYTVIDVFTLYTAEVFLAPIERLAVYRPSQRSGIAVFDDEGKLVAFRQMEDKPDHVIGGVDAPHHGNPGPYSQAWEWSTFWGRGRTDCEGGVR